MSYKIDVRREPDYLYVKAWGVRSVENLMSIARDSLKANEKYGYENILVDVCDMIGQLSTFDVYNFGEEANGKFKKLRSSGKTAIVDLEENRQRFRFVETVLINRGFDVRFFANATDAEQWFRKSK